MFLAFLFLLSWQTRLILRPGILNGGNWEYGILGVYGTEMLLWLIVIIWGIEKVKGQNIKYWILNIKILIKKIFNIQYSISLVSLISLILLSLFVSSDKMVAWQSWRYIFEAIVVFFLIRRHYRPSWLTWSFLAGLSIQSILAIWQFLSQSTFASRLLGLTNHFPWQAGSAVLEGDFGRWLRVYGGLPHPNVLGGYLAVGLFLIVLTSLRRCIIKNKKYLIFNIQYLIYCLLFTALFFTFSRSAWLGLLMVTLLHCYIVIKNKKYLIRQLADNIQYLIIPILLFSIFCFLFSPLLSSRLSGTDRLEVQSTSERLVGYFEAWQLFKKHPLVGVGLGNYTLAVHQEFDSSRPSYLYQPVHNVFVLAMTEVGFIGLIVFVTLIYLATKILNIKYLIFNIQYPISNILILFFILGLFDHYLWSLYSGWMLMAVGSGLALSGQVKDAKI